MDGVLFGLCCLCGQQDVHKICEFMYANNKKYFLNLMDRVASFWCEDCGIPLCISENVNTH